MLEHFEEIETLLNQITAILELLRSADNSADISSVNIAADMCMTMADEIAIEISKMEKESKEEKRRKAK